MGVQIDKGPNFVVELVQKAKVNKFISFASVKKN